MIVDRGMPPLPERHEGERDRETRVVPFRPKPQPPTASRRPTPDGDDPTPPAA